MQEVTFTLQTVTPLFLAGANPENAELRAPSFRGVMRYWYRALVGGVVGVDESTLQQIVKAETAVFGATDTGSAITIRVSDPSKTPDQYRKEGTRASTSGKDYLLWSMAESGKGKPTYKPDRLFFPQNTSFKVVLSEHGENVAVLQQAIAAFWLLTHLGGIGSRSRRCAGSLTATLAKTEDIIPSDMRFSIPTSVADLRRQLADGVHAAQKLTAKKMENSAQKTRRLAPFDIISQDTCRIWIVQDKDRPWNSAEDAMRAIGEDLQEYRGNIKPIQRRRVFGLPLKDVDNKARHASPLMLHIAELQGNKYVCIAVLFKTASEGISANDYELVEEWATGFSGNVEVTL